MHSLSPPRPPIAFPHAAASSNYNKENQLKQSPSRKSRLKNLFLTSKNIHLKCEESHDDGKSGKLLSSYFHCGLQKKKKKKRGEHAVVAI